MSYDSVDKLQKTLSEKVFHYAKDSKKAAGRALGTLVEIITYYLLNEWDLGYNTTIEGRLVEFGNPEITHNVEYSLHPILSQFETILTPPELPITKSKLSRNCDRIKELLNSYTEKNNTLLSKDLILRNSCIIGEDDFTHLNAFLNSYRKNKAVIKIVKKMTKPFAMVECKRVGIEEGNKKGPQTIEKAKQGAYVAKSVSNLQKIRNSDGILFGTIPKEDDKFHTKPYTDLLEELINSPDTSMLQEFILTIGIVSNHGNWFTSDNPNKELKVLKQAYDWLIFLTDNGLSEFIDNLILRPSSTYRQVRKAFLTSYKGNSGNNQFTKVKMNLTADRLLKRYFNENIAVVTDWFNVLGPKSKSMSDIKQQLELLSQKDWDKIMITR
ncbi:MAG: hypothetical protein GY855_02015 [candidate division Zixibacteria bacterium]|nr:hypothetical protein [candidate division Zixibacteria bacterium]